MSLFCPAAIKAAMDYSDHHIRLLLGSMLARVRDLLGEKLVCKLAIRGYRTCLPGASLARLEESQCRFILAVAFAGSCEAVVECSKSQDIVQLEG